MVPALRQLALHKIPGILKVHVPDTMGVLAMLDLIHYVFDGQHTPEDVNGKPEPLRQVIVKFVIMQLDLIGPSPLFAERLARGGTFVSLFWKEMHPALLAETA